MSKEQFLMYAIKHTKLNTYMSISEFRLELKRFKAIKRAFVAYEKHGKIELPLLITHFVILNNIFPTQVLNQFLFAEIPFPHWPKLKTVLLFLDLLIQEKILKLLTDPIVIVKLNSIHIDEKLKKLLEYEIQNK